MAVIDRNRVRQTMDLSAAERTAKGPERMLRENDVAQLLKAAWDDANEKARADFLAGVDKSVTNWPWSVVKAVSPRGGGGGGGGGGIVLAPPKPALPSVPPVLTLILGQVDLPDVDPGNRIPDRKTPEGTAWEPLYRALETWDTATIAKWWSLTGWAQPNQATEGAPKDQGFDPSGQGTGSNGAGSSNGANGSGLVPQAPETWTTRRVVIVAGAAVVVTGLAVVSVMSLSRARDLARLNEALRSQENR